jgi:hypothetical protein
MTRMEFLQEMTNEWLLFVKDKPMYDQTFMADKAKCLISHLSRSNLGGRDKLTHAKCRKLIVHAELRLMEIEDENSEETARDNLMEEIDEQEVQEIGRNTDGELIDVREKSVGLTVRVNNTQEEEVDEDNNWVPEENRNNRSKLEWSLSKLLEKSDEEIFESGTDLEDTIGISLEKKVRDSKKEEQPMDAGSVA